jgi:hypothetical protein
MLENKYMLKKLTTYIAFLTLAGTLSGIATAQEPPKSFHSHGAWRLYGFKGPCVACHGGEKGKKDLLASAKASVPQVAANGAGNGETTSSLWQFLGLPHIDHLFTVEESVSDTENPTKICLGCHDGNVAGHITNMHKTADAPFTPSGEHPIDVNYYAAMAVRGNSAALKSPTSSFIGNHRVKIRDVLWKGRILTCVSCHDPHAIEVAEVAKGQKDNHLYASENRDELCRSCHAFYGKEIGAL